MKASQKRKVSRAEKTTAVKTVRQMIKKHNEKKTIRVFVAGGARPGQNPNYTKEAFNLGVEIGKHDYQLTFGLSSRGIMGAVAKGVLESWKKKDHKLAKPIRGITTEHYQSLYPDDDVLGEMTDVIVAHTLEERKQSLLDADFVVFAPGGLGTLDELAYDCIAMQDGLLEVKPFVLFNVDGFFHHLLEYLKAIHLRGFSDQMPFIVVDNVFETAVAFAMIAHYRLKIKDKKRAADVVDKIIHELPYVIEQRQKNPGMSVGTILRDKDSIFKGDDLAKKQELSRIIETAYLNKEIQRMYDRLATTGRDTALISHKLANLKARMETTRT
ncbi:MAG: LOG family protein [Alphaproteobacteria bacterium]|nr:LOG family protein [Alphaproteobacteria bacterium]